MEEKQLPFEMATEILYRLPVKPLLRFRCVSKPYCSLIDSSDFAKRQLSHSLNNNTNITLHIVDCNKITCFDYNSLNIDHKFDLKTPLKEQQQKQQNPDRSIKRVGYCNGLLCLCCSSENLILVNTATRKQKILPFCDKGKLKAFAFVCGFGYDSCNDDYKVVIFNQFSDLLAQQWRSEIVVYSLKMNVWRLVNVDLPYSIISHHNEAAFVSGNVNFQVASLSMIVPCFVSHKIPGNIIVGFDLSTEKLKEVPLPDALVPNEKHLNVAELGGCLCVVPMADRNLACGDIWVMKEYGNKESWTKLFSFALEYVYKYWTPIPVAYSRSGDKVLLAVTKGESGRKMIFWHDLKENKMRPVKEVNGKLPQSFVADVMADSLIWPDVAERKEQKEVKDKKHNKPRKNKKKNLKSRDDFLSKGFNLTL